MAQLRSVKLANVEAVVNLAEPIAGLSGKTFGTLRKPYKSKLGNAVYAVSGLFFGDQAAFHYG